MNVHVGRRGEVIDTDERQRETNRQTEKEKETEKRAQTDLNFGVTGAREQNCFEVDQLVECND